jgi:hypothetical protein
MAKINPNTVKRICVVLREQSSERNNENFKRSGDNAGGVPPVPIPNTEVKTSRADDTWTAGSWESRSLPGKKKETVLKKIVSFIFI